MTKTNENAQFSLRWRTVGLLSGVGPGLTFAGIAALVGDLLGPAINVPAGAIAFASAIALAGPAVLLLLSRRSRGNLVTRQNVPAIAGYALTTVVGSVVLPGRIAAILAIGVGVLVRTGVGFAAGLMEGSRPDSSDIGNG